jgi:hypothetical protein
MGRRPRAGCRRGRKGACRYLDRPCRSLVRLRCSSPPTIPVGAESTPCPCRAPTPHGRVPPPRPHAPRARAPAAPLRPAGPPRRPPVRALLRRSDHNSRARRTGGGCRRPAASNDHKSRSMGPVGGTARPVARSRLTARPAAVTRLWLTARPAAAARSWSTAPPGRPPTRGRPPRPPPHSPGLLQPRAAARITSSGAASPVKRVKLSAP